MTLWTRRDMLRSGLAGLAAGGVATWTLRADAQPTPATEDVHEYQQFLDAQGIPRIEPTGRWSATTDDILGPFHLPGAPFRGKVTPPLEPGELLVVRGRVWGFDTKKPVKHAVIDVWQADAEGRYDMDDPRKPPERSGFRNRIRLMTDETGFYEYETIKPGAYAIDAAGRTFRPAHIHYMIQAAGYRKLVTQLYFRGDPHIAADQWVSRSKLVIAPQVVTVPGREPNEPNAGTYQRGRFDIVLQPA